MAFLVLFLFHQLLRHRRKLRLQASLICGAEGLPAPHGVDTALQVDPVAIHGRRAPWLGMVGDGWGWLGMVGDGWGWLGMVGDGWGWLGMGVRDGVRDGVRRRVRWSEVGSWAGLRCSCWGWCFLRYLRCFGQHLGLKTDSLKRGLDHREGIECWEMREYLKVIWCFCRAHGQELPKNPCKRCET